MLFAYFIPALFGLLIGGTVGFALVFVMPGTFRSLDMQVIGGAVIGGIFGAVIGSISGNPNAHSDQGSHRAVAAFITGAIGGVLAASKMKALWVILEYFRIISPS